MREIYIKIKAGLLPIGRRGENLATRVHLAEVPAEGQAVAVYVLRNGDSASYPASQVEVTDTEIIWTVTSIDTGKSGRGKVQYRFSDSVTGEVIKTEIYGFLVGLAIDTEVGPAPDPYETWLDSLTGLAGQAQVAAREAESEATRAATYAEQAEASATAASASATTATAKAAEAALSATQARNSAISAADSERGAVAKAAEAAQSAESAGASATSAEESAESASASAESASASKTAAEAARQQAYESAQSSQTYSGQSQTYASQAATSATSAGQSATAASASATSASQSATTATSKASEASASATTATTKASEASASATAAQEARTGAETAQAGAESAAQTAQAGADAVGLLREQIYNSYPNVEAEAGPIVSISDGADGIPVKSLVVGIEPVQSGSGDPSPDNVRPITGWTGAKVQRTGKNLLPNLTGQRTSESIFIGQINGLTYPLHMQSGVTYCVSFVADGTSPSVYFKENGGTNQLWGASDSTYTPSKDMDVQLWVYTNGLTSVRDAQLELGSTPTAYEPYQAETYPITFPSSAGPVYGGSLDVTTGVLTVDRAMVTYDGSESSWIWYGPYQQASIPLTNPAKYASDLISWRCNRLTPVKNISRPQNTGNYSSLVSSGASAAFSAPECDTLDKFKTWVGTNNIQFVYDLATPVTYQLTPTEVTTLLGSNSIWADTGDVQEMAYRADTKLYIDEVFEDYQGDLADYADALAALG